jgi:hypothetical protein
MKNILEILKSQITSLAEDFKKSAEDRDKLAEQGLDVKSYAMRAVETNENNPTVFDTTGRASRDQVKIKSNGNQAMKLIAQQIKSTGRSYMSVGMTPSGFMAWADEYEDDGVLSMAERWLVDVDVNNEIPREYKDNNWSSLMKDLEDAINYSISKSEPKKAKQEEYRRIRADSIGDDEEQAAIDEIQKNTHLLATEIVSDDGDQFPIEFQPKQFQLGMARINSFGAHSAKILESRGAAGSGKDYVSDGIKNNKDIFDLEATDPAKKDSLNAVKAQLTGAISERKIIMKQKQEKLISEANKSAENHASAKTKLSGVAGHKFEVN